MTPLQALHNRGFTVRLLGQDQLHILPAPNGLTQKIRQHKSAIISDLKKHQSEMVDQARKMEKRILAAMDSRRITQSDAESKLTYIFRLTCTTPAPVPACHCGEVLLWCSEEESAAALNPEKKLPLLCYNCCPPTAPALYFLADADLQRPKSKPENLEHKTGWL